jgi:hypothetical protein
MPRKTSNVITIRLCPASFRMTRDATLRELLLALSHSVAFSAHRVSVASRRSYSG